MLEDGYCPSCGTWGLVVEELGWCASCVLEHRPEHRICRRCGAMFPSSKNGYYCGKCKELNWLEKNADEVEALILSGTPFKQARDIVAQNNRPKCIVCSTEIRGGRPNALFCGKTEQCIKARRFYQRLRSRGATSDLAVALMGGIYEHSN